MRGVIGRKVKLDEFEIFDRNKLRSLLFGKKFIEVKDIVKSEDVLIVDTNVGRFFLYVDKDNRIYDFDFELLK